MYVCYKDMEHQAEGAHVSGLYVNSGCIYEFAVMCPSIDRFATHAKVEQNSGRSDGQGPCVKSKV